MVKSTLVLILMVAQSAILMAQSNIFIHTEDGEQFYLVLNGFRQNDQPQMFIKVKGITGKSVRIKVVFADSALGILQKVVPLASKPMEMTFVLRQDTAGHYFMKLMGQEPIDNTQSYPGAVELAYTTAAKPPIQFVPVIRPMPANNAVYEDPGIDMHDCCKGNKVSDTTITTTSTETAPEKTAYTLPGYDGPVGCANAPMKENDFLVAKQSIASKQSEESKQAAAKLFIDSNCMLTDQVKQLMVVLSFEETKLELAKYAYTHTFDIGNYYKVNDVFQFSTSVDELNDFIQGKMK